MSIALGTGKFDHIRSRLSSMLAEQKKSRLISMAVGAAMILAAIMGVIFIQWKPEPEFFPPLIRPLKTTVIRPLQEYPSKKYPAKVRANEKVNLAFQVDGPLIELAVKKGQEVDKGQLLARIDPRDYENNLAAAKAEKDRAEAYLKRISKAVLTGAVSQTELSNAHADMEKAQANEKIAEKALEDTQLFAKFTGIIADRFVENFENVDAKQPILSLQDITSVEIEANVPQERVAMSREERGKYRFTATFDYLPGRRYDVKIKEFSTEADPITQTYTATFVMPAPDEVTILPGMTATVTEYRKGPVQEDYTVFAIPINAVAIDGVGMYYVWIVKTDSEGNLTTHRRNVRVGEMIEDKVIITHGLSVGERIATAGVNFLQQDQQIRLLESNRGSDWQ